MRSDGSKETQLTSDPRRDFGPDLSPDGTQIVFEREIGPAVFRVWVMNADGSDQHQVEAPAVPDGSPAPPTVSSDRYPSWSPDGTRIAFIRTSRHRSRDHAHATRRE